MEQCACCYTSKFEYLVEKSFLIHNITYTGAFEPQGVDVLQTNFVKQLLMKKNIIQKQKSHQLSLLYEYQTEWSNRTLLSSFQ